MKDESIQVMGVRGLPLIQEGDDLCTLISERVDLQEGDIICIASSVYSKAMGYTRSLGEIIPSERACRIAGRTGEDPRFIQGVLDASKEVLLEYPFVLSELPCGHVGVRAGVDQSNIEKEHIILLPPDPMGAAFDLKEGFLSVKTSKTGEKVDVPPKKIPYFKMGKELKALLNSVAAAEEQAPALPPEGA